MSTLIIKAIIIPLSSLLLILYTFPSIAQTSTINRDSAIAILTDIRTEHYPQDRSDVKLQLKWNDKLYRAALQHAKDMHKREAMRHKFFMQPDLKGKLKRVDVTYKFAQETIQYGCKYMSCTFRDWMNSPPHREALLDHRNKEFAVARYGNYWCALFIDPMN